MELIPKDGSGIIVANHPFGGIEGIALAAILKRVRSDVKIMANHYLSIVPELRDLFIFVDPFRSKKSIHHNISKMKETIQWVKNGGLLAIFPAGEVSHYNLEQGKVTDPPWQINTGKLIEKLNAPVTPVYFEGANRLVFQTLGLLHPFLRTVRLPAELLNKRNTTIALHIGNPITPKKLASYGNTAGQLDYLRRRTYNLIHRPILADKDLPDKSQDLQPIVEPIKSAHLIEEIELLPESQTLYRHGASHVFYGYAYQIPKLLHEIGREREITFREVNEGSGKSIDLDNFDEHYIHLVTWDEEKKRIIGSYRLGLTDIILRDIGTRGLYTNSLFKLKPWFLKEVSPAIEMGRSFITKEYQRSFNSLYLLWRGIGEFVARHPHYRFLFGPVSISNAYALASQKLMLKFLHKQHGNVRLSRSVSPVHSVGDKLKSIQFTEQELINIAELEEMISDIEGKTSGLPILIKQYIKLGAEFLAFNRDPDFSDVLDGLIVVDLTKTNSKILGRYMGQTGTEFYKKYHERRTESKYRQFN
jgi:putative hemolysin